MLYPFMPCLICKAGGEGTQGDERKGVVMKTVLVGATGHSLCFLNCNLFSIYGQHFWLPTERRPLINEAVGSSGAGSEKGCCEERHFSNVL